MKKLEGLNKVGFASVFGVKLEGCDLRYVSN
jgi:hypothetical protein